MTAFGDGYRACTMSRIAEEARDAENRAARLADVLYGEARTTLLDMGDSLRKARQAAEMLATVMSDLPDSARKASAMTLTGYDSERAQRLLDETRVQSTSV